jgi:DNA-binding PadR family transcriptional regulator
MNVRTLCLAILHEKEATGYEIRKLSTEGEYAYFVEASFGSIYPALAKMEDEGLLTSRVELQDGRPAKKVYAITEAGRTAFQNSLFEQLDNDIFRSEFLLFARFAAILPASLVETRIRERMTAMDDEIANLRKLDEKRCHAGDAWVIRYGISCLEVARGHIETHMDELIALARPDEPVAQAAE